MHILAFLIRRSVQAVIVMLIISIIGFSIQDQLGDPLRELVGQAVSEAEREALRDRMGLNDPFWTQYPLSRQRAGRRSGRLLFFQETGAQGNSGQVPGHLQTGAGRHLPFRLALYPWRNLLRHPPALGVVAVHYGRLDHRPLDSDLPDRDLPDLDLRGGVGRDAVLRAR
jgi:hypothetical protein